MSDNTTAVAPIDKKRLAIFKDMTEATQEVARDFEGKLSKGATGLVMIQYDVGSRLADIIADEGTYGAGAVKQLSLYLGIPGGETTLYNLRNFAQEFDKEFVRQWTSKSMAGGGHLAMAHWFQIMKLKSKEKQEKLLNRTLKESWSANDLEKEVRAGSGGKTKNVRGGGRKPQTPTSPMAGLQKAFSVAQQLNRLEPVLLESVFDKIDSLEPDKVTDTLLEKLETTRDQVAETQETSGEMLTHLEKNIKRVTKILEKQKAAAEEAGDEDEDAGEEAPKKKKKKPASASSNGKAESNGHVDGAKKKKKKKKLRPVAAEA